MKNYSLKIYINTLKYLALILFVYFSYGCSKNYDIVDTILPKKIAIKVRVQSSSFDNLIILAKKASISGNLDFQSDSYMLQRNSTALNKDFLLISELSPEYNNLIKSYKSISSLGGLHAATEIENVEANILYKVVVYDNDGLYITEKDYINGQEATAGDFLLDGSKNYSFICYSVNSTTLLPEVTFSNPSNKTLSTSSVYVSGNEDIMYYRKDFAVIGNNTTNYLEISFKHLMSQITTTFDATATGYNITAITSNFSPHLPTAVLNFTDGSVTRTGISGTSLVSFGVLNTATVTSLPTIINAASNNTTSYTISSITVGSITESNILAFTNLVINPGVKYNLKLKIVPMDEYLIHENLPAARINGKIWMRHNLGVNTNLDPDQNPMVDLLHGNYYQWGRLVPSGTGTSNVASPYLNNNAPANNSWNSGTETDPEKTALDPCPENYRIPTAAEQESLLNDTQVSNIGPFTSGNNNYNSAKVFVSKRNSAVKLTFPAQGYFVVGGAGGPYTSLGINGTRGGEGRYHSSFSSNNPRTKWLDFTSSTAEITNRGNNPSAKVVSLNIRCIAE